MSTAESNAEAKKRALAEYQHSDLKVVEICRKHRVPVSTLSAWVQEEGVRRRPRGRRHLTEPAPRAQTILAFAAMHGFAEAARHFNASKQYVSSLGKRWGVVPPRAVRSIGSSPAVAAVAGRAAKPKRETVVSFRLGRCQVAALLATLQPSITESTRSVHKLMRAALLQRIEAHRNM